MKNPSPFAIVEVSWGENKKHLFAKDAESLQWYATEAEARSALEAELESGSKLMALLVIEGVYKTISVEIEKVC